jgi:hypothetical protein
LFQSFLPNLAIDLLELRSLEVGLVAAVARQVFRFLLLLCEGLQMFVVGWLLGLFRGPELQSLEMSLRPEAPFRVSSWVAFHGCSLEHINGGHQCWGSNVEGYRTPTGKVNDAQREMEEGTENDTNSCRSNLSPPPLEVPVWIYL